MEDAVFVCVELFEIVLDFLWSVAYWLMEQEEKEKGEIEFDHEGLVIV